MPSPLRQLAAGFCSLCALTLWTAPAHAQPAVSSSLIQARSLVASGNIGDAEQAYQALLPLASRRALDPEFNHLLGLAALHSGRNSQAIFALQRAVAAAPDHAAARMDLARAYFAAGDNEDARREFAILATQNPPARARAAITRYQAAIKRRATAYEPGWSAAINAEAGFDSNANGGTSDDQFLGFVLNEASREADSAYIGAAANAGYRTPLTPDLGWRVDGGLAHREYPDAEFVTQTDLSGRSGLVWSPSAWRFNTDFFGANQWLDGEDNRQILGLDLGLSRAISAASRWQLNLRTAAVRYDELLQVQDVNQIIVSSALVWRPQGARRWQFEVGALGGTEDASDDDSPFGRNLFGAQARATVLIRGWRAQMGGGLLGSDYDGLFFGEERQDVQVRLNIQMETPPFLGGWSLTPLLALISNQSDVDLYEYDRLQAGLSLKRSW